MNKQLTVCCQNCRLYPHCTDFQAWANFEGQSMTRPIVVKTFEDCCPTCGRYNAGTKELKSRRANGLMLATCCEGKKFVERPRKEK